MSNRILSETIPVAPLKILIMPHLMELGKKVNHHLVHKPQQLNALDFESYHLEKSKSLFHIADKYFDYLKYRLR